MKRSIVVSKKVWVSALAVALAPATAVPHGSMEVPLSRNYQCFREGPESPDSAACRAAVQASGTQQLYDWNGYNQNPNAGPRNLAAHRAFIPDGRLCAAGHEAFRGMDLGRSDWRATNVSAGASVTFTYHATAPHSTKYHELYITRNGWNPNVPLRWTDLEGPFCETGSVPLANQRYRIGCRLPSNKSGRHVVYHIWQRNDSPEAFYACTDVNFGGTPDPTPTPTPNPSPTPTPAPTPTPTPNPTPTPTPGGTWAPWTPYATGAVVTYQGASYRCIQGHTSQPDWTPPVVPALWGRQ